MKDTCSTLGVYGIQGIADSNYQQIVHDHGLALMNDGRVEKYLHLERISHIKNDNTLHVHLPDLIKNAGWENPNFDVVFVDNIVGRAMISTNGQIRFEAPLISRLTKDWELGRLNWFNKNLNGYVVNHELAHIFSCLPFYGDFIDNSLLIHFDGGASFSNFSAWIFRMGKIIPVEHHWELKYLTSLYNANELTFSIINADKKEQLSVPDKLMGYSALGSYNEDIEFWLRQNKWFENICNKSSLFLERVKSDFNIDIKHFDKRNTFIQDVAATIQEVFMRETLMKFDDLNSISNCRNLYYTGGCALNTNTNSVLVESQLFDNIYIPPCPDDSGLALGAASYGEWKKGNTIKISSPYLNSWGLDQDNEGYEYSDLENAALLLINGKVIATCNGIGEAGPKALGNRSILALPTKALSNKVSVEMKRLEWYMPLATVMLEKNTQFFTGSKTVNQLSRYMLLDMKILPERQNEIQGVVNANGTARVQTIFSKEDNPYLFELLTLLDEKHAVKALINTSFCADNEAIVHTISDALLTAERIGVDAVVINGKLKVTSAN